MDHKLISYCDIKNRTRLDQGQFGVVYRAEYNDLKVAAKEITPPDTGQEFVNTFRREVEINSQLDHDNIVKFYGACFDPFCILMEYVEGGSLYSWIYRDRFRFDDDTILSLLLGMTRGLKYLHDLKVLHRDLKSKNVLIVKEADGGLSPKLCDFGVSKTLNATMNVNTQEIGTVRWMAPEVMSSNTYNHKCDIYSLGVTMFEILELDLPYKDDEPFRIMMMKAVERRPLQLSPSVARESHQIFVNLFNKCVQYDPGERPNLLEILLKLQSADLRSGSDTALEVDDDTRMAWELQQAEYQSLSIITQADEQYAMDLQHRFYMQNIQPYYPGASQQRHTSKWDKNYRQGVSFTSTGGSIDAVQHEDSSGYGDQFSPTSNIEFYYGPPSLPSQLGESSESIGSAHRPEQEPEPEPSDFNELEPLVRLNLEDNPISDFSPQCDTLTPASNHLSPSPSPSSLSEDTRALGAEERHHLDKMALSPVMVSTPVGHFVDLGSTGSLPDLHTPPPVCKSASMELTPKRTSPMNKLMKLMRLDSRSKSPEHFRDRNQTYSHAKIYRRPQLDPTTRSQTLDTQTPRDTFPQTGDTMYFAPSHIYQRATSDYPAT